ncbi:MAG TPA: amino acid adenylation domain-containing protein [Pyrinomonadaceae bacterium]
MDAYPLTAMQAGMLFHSELDPEAGLYHDIFSFHLQIPFDAAALKAALQQTIDLHPVLRTSFNLSDFSEPLQLVHEKFAVPLRIGDLRGLSPAEQEEYLAQWLVEEKRHRFDWRQGPPLRFQIERRSQESIQFSFSFHHAILDGWSLATMLTELFDVYSGRQTDESAVGASFRDFVAAERAIVNSEAAQHYWATQLSESPDSRLPRLGQSAGPSGVACHRIAISPELSFALKELARTAGVPLKSVLLAAHLRALSVLTGSNDVLTGIASHGRPETADGERVLGLFLNTLPFRRRLAGGTWLELVQETFAAERELLPFRRYPMARMQQDLGNDAPLFEVLFNFVHFHVYEKLQHVSGLEVLGFNGVADTNFTLAVDFSLELAGSQISLELNYDAAELSEQIEAISGYYERTLVAMTTNPHERYDLCQLLSEAELRRQLEDWNHRTSSFPHTHCIHQLFAEQVAANPEAVALEFGEQRLTYAQLNDRANQLAGYLVARGAGTESVVGIAMERSPDMIVSLLGVLKTGGAYLPLDPDYPQERLAFMLEDAAVRVVLTHRALCHHLPQTEADVICLDEAWTEITAGSKEDPERSVSGDSLAYITYTSGSTGQPKGVQIPHRGVVRLVKENDFAHLGADEACLQFAPLAFDASTFEIWGMLLNGGRLVIMPPGPSTLTELGQTLRTHRVTVLWLTAGLFNLMVDEQLDALRGLRQLLAGGDALSVSHVERFLREAPGCKLINGYGPTENTTFTCCYSMNTATRFGNSVPIGRPIANTQVYILDENLRPVATGARGELYTGGDGLARGYLNHPELTAERFVPHPFSSQPGARLYRTGDWARYLLNGDIEFLGRVDNQAKVRGFRIEPGEIEAVLRGHQQVREAVVLLKEADGDKHLVAYVASDAQTGELREYLKKRLPDYMVPSFFVHLNEIPLTANGKIDRRALPEPESFFAVAAEYEAPRTPAEELLSSLWASVLRVSRVGIKDNFFDLGGHSLLAIQLNSRIRDAFGVELPLSELFESRTLAELAQAIDDLMRASHELEVPPLRPASDDVLPLSFAQQRLWFLDQLMPESVAYNLAHALRLRGELNHAALEQALNEIVRRHEAVRTTFSGVDGNPIQVITPFRHLALPLVDLSSLPDEEREVQAARIASAEAQRPFDLQSGPLLRVTLLLLGAEDHVLLLSMHHIISDGWSNRILVDEMTALYDTFATGTGSPLPELAIQYGDFAMWQRQWLAGDVLARQLDYWTSKLQGVPDLLALPTDYPRPKVQLTEGAICTYFLNAELTSDLKSLAQQSRATLYMLMLAAFHALLHRYARQATIVTGTPTANRTPVETEPLIGFFVNTLVLRSDFGDDPTFLTHLDRLRKHALEAYTHHDLPFEMLVDELQLERDLSYHPLFQVMFSWEEAALDELTLKGLELGTVGVENHTSQFDLTLRVGEINGRLRCAMQYNTALFEAGTIKRMLGHYEQLLASVVREPQQRISELPLLTGAEKNQLLVEWNDTRAVYDYAASVVQLFEQQVKRTPVAPALVCKDERLSYRVLNSRANQLARYLRRAGIAPESRVGLCVERSLEMVVAMLAVLKAGGAYVPLDPAYPRKRLHFMLEDAGVKVLVTQSQVQDRLKLDAGEVILLDQNWDEIAREADDDLALSVAPDNLAYVIYTSGSSGVPKGVMVQHGSIVNLAAGLQRAVYDELSDGPFRVGLNASLGFDASVQQWVQLLAGNTLVLIPEELRREARELLAYVEEQQIAVLDCTPTQLQMLFEAGFGQQHPPSLRTLLVGGEAISAELWQQLQQDARLRYFNVYGPTECTVDSTVCLLQRESADVTIGRPMTNVQNYILDQQQLPVPVGVVGELYIGGAGVARGYLDQPGLTAERFVPDAFSGEAGARIYRSGDLARYLSDGQIEFLGRADGQIKVRGHRIELGEIEAALRQLPGISNAAAVVTDDKGSGKRIVGYVVADPEVRVDQLLAQLKQRLPDFMLPAVLVALDALPLTGSGKVDRRALAELEVSGDAQLAESYRAPRTIVEEALCGLWQELLQVERVGVNHNFFELGGHSLLATRLMSRVRETFGVELPLRDLFVRPTVAGLAEQVEEALRGGVRVTAPPLVPVSREQLLPLSHAQERLWFLDQLKPGSVTYNVPGAVRLKGRLDVEALRRTLNEVVRRHEVLRTTFVSVIGQPVQVISPASQVELPVHDLSDLPEEQREAEARLLTQAEAAQPFDLSIGPLVRVQLLRFAEEDHVMLFTLHHIISDEWSTGILVREVAALYEAYIEGRESPLPELEIQYADYAVWQREWLQDEVLDQQLEYWRQQLGDELPVLQLPTDKPRPPVLSPQGRTINFIVPAQLTAELKKLSNGEGVTLFMTLLAAFKILLWRYSGQSDVVVGTPIADRNQLAIEGLMGLFVNTLVLRTSLSGNPSFRELLGRVREVTLGAYAHRDLPFEKLVEELQPERDMNRSPLFQVLFTVQNAAAETLQLPGLEASEITADDETAKFDLTLGLVRMEGELHGLLQYNTDLFEATTVERIAGHFQSLLATIAKDPEQKLHELSSVMSAEQRRLLVEWNHTQTDWPAGFVAELFTEQAQRTPENDAVIDGEQRVSYRELNERANQLAHYLQSLGVGPETVVGLLLPRSVEMVVGLLGILKAGGAYLPLDTQLPRGRREFMLKDAGVTVLLTPETFASEQLTQASRTNLASNTTAENLAYVIYTSGSTGQPKGTLITQGGLINYLNWAMQNYPVSEGCGSVLHSSLSFDLTVTSIYPALLMGRSVEIVSQEDGVTGLAEALTRQPNYSLVKLTPAHVELLAAQLPDLTNTTHSLVIGGENLLAGTVERWRDEAPQTRLFNEYGPTETVVGCSVYEIGFETEWNGSIPIGRPIANTQLYILDDEGEVVPLGVKGELYIGGAGVARGYLNRPDLTAERFVPDAYTGVRGARLYRTGDLARYRADGQIEFLGRADNQVKLRGHRIELEEIEAVLRGHDAVREVVVLVTDNGQAGQRIVAYVVRSNTAIGLNDLRAYLHGRLPDYMVPATFVWLDAVPMTTNGKVDRKALSSMEPGTDPTLPRDVLELELTRIWEEVLESGPISPKDNFFELGGHSLLAVQLIDKVERLVGLQIPLSSLFEGATVEQMASMLRQRVGKISEQSLVTIQGEGTRPPLFLVHSASGNVMSYIALARRLGSEQPVYGLQSKGLDPDREPTVRVEDMASEYLEELFNVQPDGPYFLAGWSMGGVIAFEMARQLTAQGKSVAPVLLIDATIQTGRFKTNGWDDYSLLLALAQHHGLYWDDGDHTLDDLRSLSLDEQLALLLEKGAGYNQFPLNMGVPQLRHLFELFKVNSHANLRYRPAKSEQQIILLQAADAPPRHAATVLRRWRKVAEVVEVHRLPGDHYSMLTEPNVTLLAEQINSYLSA